MPLGLPVVQGRVPVELASAEMHEIEMIKTERLCSEEHTSILHLLFLVCILCIACKFSAWIKDTDNLQWQNYWKNMPWPIFLENSKNIPVHTVAVSTMAVKHQQLLFLFTQIMITSNSFWRSLIIITYSALYVWLSWPNLLDSSPGIALHLTCEA